MDATLPQKVCSLIDKLRQDYPEISFEESITTAWSPSEKTVFYQGESSVNTILHELGHGLLMHTEYNRDIELLKLEFLAWQKAKEISVKYAIKITDTEIENHLDTYRDWLHARSTCPSCQTTGLQDTENSYKCLTCHHKWRVNQARTCALRRYSIK